jgi:aminoglycoside phosphotransferase (APT) family kinase protein
MTAPEVPDGSRAPSDSAPPGLDLTRLAEYLSAKQPGLVSEPLRVELVPGGRSNLTYILNDTLVVRRPPLGHVLATAHDMAREFRVISALAPTPVPVPETLLLCEDDSVLGAPFYVMRRVPGMVYRRRAETDTLTAEQRQGLAYAMIDTLAVLHRVDPASVGLAGFGRPEGFLTRQVARWAAQLDRSRSRELAGAEELHALLSAEVPDSPRPSIVHGDFRLDNMMIDPATLRVAAVLDWEMATLGDPLTDLGLLVTYWDIMGELELAAGNPITDARGTQAGFPPARELLARYAAGSTLDLSDLHWYVGLACYKLAVILEGIHYRYTQGKTVGPGFDRIGLLVAPLLAAGLSAMSAKMPSARGPSGARLADQADE